MTLTRRLRRFFSITISVLVVMILLNRPIRDFLHGRALLHFLESFLSAICIVPCALMGFPLPYFVFTHDAGSHVENLIGSLVGGALGLFFGIMVLVGIGFFLKLLVLWGKQETTFKEVFEKETIPMRKALYRFHMWRNAERRKGEMHKSGITRGELKAKFRREEF